MRLVDQQHAIEGLRQRRQRQVEAGAGAEHGYGPARGDRRDGRFDGAMAALEMRLPRVLLPPAARPQANRVTQMGTEVGRRSGQAAEIEEAFGQHGWTLVRSGHRRKRLRSSIHRSCDREATLA